MKLLGIIPARGGSKRLPRKNITPLEGKPLVQYTMEAAVSSDVFDKVILSSEDKEILALAESIEGISVMKRPEQLADDDVSVLDVANAVLDILGEDYDYILIMLATTPFRDHQDIKKVEEILASEKPNAVVSVTNYQHSPGFAIGVNKEGHLSRNISDLEILKIDDASKYLVDNGGIYALKPKFIREKNYFPPHTLPYLMPFWRSIDIDLEADLELAKALYPMYEAYKINS